MSEHSAHEGAIHEIKHCTVFLLTIALLFKDIQSLPHILNSRCSEGLLIEIQP